MMKLCRLMLFWMSTQSDTGVSCGDIFCVKFYKCPSIYSSCTVCEKRLEAVWREAKRKENFFCVWLGLVGGGKVGAKVWVGKFQNVQLCVWPHLESYITTGHSECVHTYIYVLIYDFIFLHSRLRLSFQFVLFNFFLSHSPTRSVPELEEKFNYIDLVSLKRFSLKRIKFHREDRLSWCCYISSPMILIL